ncbi:MAG: OsmC family protein [Hydrogenobacter thermophilus]|uniref:OsmC family protein n=1 Tax=Hydrogenobacter thermophilus TaxID=940 RepID=UPI0030FB8B25|nr:OsmC family protein [Hydrogenobacter thermophilus]
MEEKRVSLTLSEEEDTYIASTSSGEIKVGERGYRPMELLLVALAGCSGVDVSGILRKKRQKVKAIKIDAVGKRREEFPRIYESIKLTYTVLGENISKKAVESAVKLSIEKYCSVYAMLSKSTKIDVEIQVWEERDYRES